MKPLILFLVLFTHNLVLAQDFIVHNPSEEEKVFPVLANDFSCKRLPFGLAGITLSLNQQVGSSEQSRILYDIGNDLMSMNECIYTVKNISRLADHYGNINVNAKIINRSVLKLTKINADTCEGAEQEIVTIKVGERLFIESIYSSEKSLDCPAGIDPSHVNKKDYVIQVLHENGIPTSSEF